jgi:4-aminobutyrate aminotransferase-like enzyme
MSRPRSHFILAPFEGCAIRITPPLTISEEEIKEGCTIILEVMDEVLMTIENK